MLPVSVQQSTLDTYLAEINHFGLLSAEEEYALAVHWHDRKDIAAAHRLVTSNLRFVVKIAREYMNYGLRLADLIQEGNVGLMKAVKKFDPYKGFRLITYAVWWIRAEIQGFVLRSWSLVKIGTTQAQRKLFFKLVGSQRKIAGLDGTPEADPAAVARDLGVDETVVMEMDQRLHHRDLSLDVTLGGEGGTSHLELLVDENDDSEKRLLEAEKARVIASEVEGLLEHLAPREREIAEKRLMAEKPATLAELGEKFGVSRERVRQMEKSLKRKLALALREKNSLALQVI